MLNEDTNSVLTKLSALKVKKEEKPEEIKEETLQLKKPSFNINQRPSPTVDNMSHEWVTNQSVMGMSHLGLSKSMGE